MHPIHLSRRATAALALPLTLLLAAADLAAQGQPVTRTSRTSGLAARAIAFGSPTALNGRPFATVYGAPGSVYAFAIQVEFPGPAVYDLSAAVPGYFGALAVQNAQILANTAFVDPNGGAVGVIGPTGAQDLNFAAPMPLSPFYVFELQAALTTPGGRFEMTNSQVRQIPLLSTPGLPTYTPSAALPGSGQTGWDDIEQGDVDGDGDLDVLGVTQTPSAGLGSVVLWRAVGSGINQFATLSVEPGATSAEFADFDRDGFLDVVVAFVNSPNYVQIWLNQGLDANNQWLGFTKLSDAIIQKVNNPSPPQPADVETADVDGDGAIDVFLTCAGFDGRFGQQNRLLRNALSGPGPVPIPGFAFLDATATNLPVISDDSEDAEFFDFDADGDLDIVVAVVDGPGSPASLGTGVDYVLVNQGGVQAGIQGTFVAPVPNPIPAVNDESADVAVGDFDGDGLPDLYFANWLDTTFDAAGNVIYGAAVDDRLLLNNGAGAFLAANWLAPGDGSGTDVEVADVDLDGTDDIIVGRGSLRRPSAPGTQRGAFVLPIPANPTLPLQRVFEPTLTGVDIRDLEFGDWQRPVLGVPLPHQSRWFDKEIGVAPLENPFSFPGLFALERL